MPAPTLDTRSFTCAHDLAVDALVASVLPEAAAAVMALELPGFRALVLGGGYGRGEGGATAEHRPYNDLDFFVFLDVPESRFPAIAAQLEPLARQLGRRLGIEVDFTLRSAYRVKLDERRLMVQELLRGYRALVPADFDLSAWSGAREYPPEMVPVGEAARLLMNRGMGLLLARGRMAEASPAAQAFVARNINKAVLGAGDARLVVEGRYQWRLAERAAELHEDRYSKACAFKRCPSATAPATWAEALQWWQVAYARLYELRGRELRRRSWYQALRWFWRRRTLGDLRTLGRDCTVRVLDGVARALAGNDTDFVAVKRDWTVFN